MRPPLFHKLFHCAKRIPYRFQEEGIPQTLWLIFQLLFGVIYRKEVVLVFSRDLSSTQFSDAPENPDGLSINLLTAIEIDDLLSVSYSSRGEILNRLAEGDLCLVAHLNGRVVHYSWLTAKIQYAWELERSIDLKPGQYYLYNCRTVRIFRGRGIYKAVIARALDETLKRNGRSLAALVKRGNANSLKAFHALGFEIVQEISFQRLGTNRQYKEKSHATAVHTNTDS